VYPADPRALAIGAPVKLVLEAAFWTHGEAYGFAQARRPERRMMDAPVSPRESDQPARLNAS
jgi:hypothetical protein